MKTTHENRRHERIFFGHDRHIAGEVSFLSRVGEDNFTVGVLDLSESGIGLFLKRDQYREVSVGDQLLLMEVQGLADLAEMMSVAMVVRWVIDHQFLEHVGFGCEFIDLSSPCRQQICQVVSKEQ